MIGPRVIAGPRFCLVPHSLATELYCSFNGGEPEATCILRGGEVRLLSKGCRKVGENNLSALRAYCRVICLGFLCSSFHFPLVLWRELFSFLVENIPLFSTNLLQI